jgi:hypothetical protein
MREAPVDDARDAPLGLILVPPLDQEIPQMRVAVEEISFLRKIFEQRPDVGGLVLFALNAVEICQQLLLIRSASSSVPRLPRRIGIRLPSARSSSGSRMTGWGTGRNGRTRRMASVSRRRVRTERFEWA